MAQSALSIEQLREERLRRERKWLLSEDGFLDFARESGACPDAEEIPHGRLSHMVLRWNGTPDPGVPGRILYRHKMVLWPRGSFKTQYFGVGNTAAEIAKNQNIRILYSSETNHQAVKPVELVKDVVDSQWYRERFGVHRGDHWVGGQFTSALRTAHHLKDPTLLAAGVGEVQTGSHWDLVIWDDVCSQKNTATPQAVEKLWGWAGEIMAQLDPGCRLLILGTLHHFADIYCRIQKDEEIRKLFDVSVHAWADPPGSAKEDIPGRKLFFPTRLSREFVLRQELFLPPRLFAHFYNNSPHGESDQLFRADYFRVIRDEIVPRAVWGYILSDFAFVEEAKDGEPDRTCFWCVMLDANRIAYVVDFQVGRWKPSDSVRLACDMWVTTSQTREMKAMTVELASHTEFLSSLFEEVRRQTFVRPRIIAIEGRSQQQKGMRIEAIEPRFRRGDIYFTESVRAKAKLWRDMVSEMTEWPFSAHDDIPDAISDLDKKDRDGRWYCPGPPAGWRPGEAQLTRPLVVDGRVSPEYRPSPREVLRREQQNSSNSLWRGTGPGQQNSFWKRRS